LVPNASTPVGGSSAPCAQPQASGALCLLWAAEQSAVPTPVFRIHRENVAQVVEPARAASASIVAGLHRLSATVPASSATGRTAWDRLSPRVSRLEEPDAGNRHVRICGGPGGMTRRAIPSA